MNESSVSRGFAGLIALSSGAAGMTVEIAAVRLLAPYFGTSVYVWTNLIGVTLFALALGAWMGGILAEKANPRQVLTGVLLGGGILALVSPFVAPAVSASVLPPDLRLDEAFHVLNLASLGTALLVFAPPIFLMGAVTPLLVKLLIESGASVGRGSGNVWALSTFGSLVGTFGTTHWFVPQFGSIATLAGAGGCLVALAILNLGSRLGRTTTPLLAATVLVGAPFAITLAAPPLRGVVPEDAALEVIRETPYQFARVVRFEREDEAGAFREWHLQVNEGLDSFQSLAREGRIFTGAYYDSLALTSLFLELPSERPTRILLLGLGGGTLVPILHALAAPLNVEIEIVGVEIDPDVVDLGRAYFGLREGGAEVHAGVDARVALEHLGGKWDLVLLDAYAAQVHIPAHLASIEFFELARERLHDGGILALNVGRLHGKDPVPVAIAATLARAFEVAWSWPVRSNRNVILFAGEELTSDAVEARVEERSKRMLATLETGPFTRRLRELSDHLRFPGVLERWNDEPNAAILTDDVPRLDLLQMEALEMEGRLP